MRFWAALVESWLCHRSPGHNWQNLSRFLSTNSNIRLTFFFRHDMQDKTLYGETHPDKCSPQICAGAIYLPAEVITAFVMSGRAFYFHFYMNNMPVTALPTRETLSIWLLCHLNNFLSVFYGQHLSNVRVWDFIMAMQPLLGSWAGRLTLFVLGILGNIWLQHSNKLGCAKKNFAVRSMYT